MVKNAAPADASSKAQQGPSSLQRALDLLKTVAGSESPVGVNELSRRIGQHVSSVSRTLATLERNGFVSRDADTGRFMLGLELVSLARRHLNDLDILRLSRPYLEQLAEDSRETSSLSLWNGKGAINVEQVLGPGSIKHIAVPGRFNPPHCTATGKAILACLPSDTVSEIVGDSLERFTPQTIVDHDALRRELTSIAEKGYCVSISEFVSEVASIAAAVLDRKQRPVAAIAVSMPAFHFNDEIEARLAPMIVAAAREMSAKL